MATCAPASGFPASLVMVPVTRPVACPHALVLESTAASSVTNNAHRLIDGFSCLGEEPWPFGHGNEPRAPRARERMRDSGRTTSCQRRQRRDSEGTAQRVTTGLLPPT